MASRRPSQAERVALLLVAFSIPLVYPVRVEGVPVLKPLEILVNGGAESAFAVPSQDFPLPSSWTKAMLGATVPTSRLYGDWYVPGWEVCIAIKGQSRFFYGGYGAASSALSQTRNVSMFKESIDGQKVLATLSGFLGALAGENDKTTVTAVFLDSTSKPIGSPLRIGPLPASSFMEPSKQTSYTTMVGATSAAVLVPKGTRFVKTTITFTYGSGSNNNAYADNISLSFHPKMVLQK